MSAKRSTDSELVAIRAACHYAYLLRALAEVEQRIPEQSLLPKTKLSPQALCDLSQQALECKRLRGAFTIQEEKWIRVKLGKLSRGRLRGMTFRSEPLGMLLWALQVPRHTGDWHRLLRNSYNCITPD